MFEDPVLGPAIAVKLKIRSILKEMCYMVGNCTLCVRKSS